jgi:hypothetical protein
MVSSTVPQKVVMAEMRKSFVRKRCEVGKMR